MDVATIKDKMDDLEDQLNRATDLASELYNDFEDAFVAKDYLDPQVGIEEDDEVDETVEEMSGELLSTLYTLQNLTDSVAEININYVIHVR